MTRCNTVPVRECSTGCNTKVEAQAIGAAEEARIRHEFLCTGDATPGGPCYYHP